MTLVAKENIKEDIRKITSTKNGVYSSHHFEGAKRMRMTDFSENNTGQQLDKRHLIYQSRKAML